MNDFFNQDFYPTPRGVIESMLAFTDIQGKYILEPSAGSGNIVDYCKEMGAKQVYACEISPKLRSILSSKCSIIAEDFLNLKSEDISHIDIIIMNPPFSNQEKHILHAYEIAPEGCEIISLCNHAMFDRYYKDNNVSKIEELIKSYGHRDYIGQCFQDAERKTNVICDCIYVNKPRTHEDEFVDFFTDEEDNEDIHTDSGMITYNFVRDCVNRYCEAVKRFDNVIATAEEINKLTEAIGGCTIKFGAYKNETYGNDITRDYFKKELQKSAWKWLIDKFKLEKYVTKSLREDLNRAIERQSQYPFTMKNIYRMVDMIIGTQTDRMNKALCEAFDTICSFSADNSTAGEKWKTNSDYMINKKFIIPYSARFGYRGNVEVNYDRYELDDITKALCYLTGTNYENIGSAYNFYYRNRVFFGELHEFAFFKIRAYKKGTMHFEFIDENVWALFNQKVAEIRGWKLPKTTTRQKNKFS